MTDFLIETFSPDWLKRRMARTQNMSPQQRWALAAGAQLTARNRHSHETLNPDPTTDADQWANNLKVWWEAGSREDLLEMCARLEHEGHRGDFRASLGHEVLSWDLVRLINLARWGFAARYLQEDEAWAQMLRAAAALHGQYASWQALADDYLLGHDEWAGEPDTRLNRDTQKLLDPRNVRSPWTRVAWETFGAPEGGQSAG